MKKNSIIVNVGRGNFIDCAALNEELNNGHLWGAALNVTNPEPLTAEIHFGKIHAALLLPMLPELPLVILSRQKLCSASLPAKT